MKNRVRYIGLDVHKETIAVAIAPGGDTEVRNYGIINGTLDALDKLLKKLRQPGIELRLVYEAGPWVMSFTGISKEGAAERWPTASPTSFAWPPTR